MRVDVCVVGAGIIGLATARSVGLRLPGASIVVVDKEADVGIHQTGHNSGVLHSGLYYRPGSLKATLCVSGRRRMVEFCEEHAVALGRCGKVVVASTADQVPALDELERRGTANGLEGLRRLGREELRAVEPHATGVDALHVPEAAVVDFPAVARTLARVVPAEVRTETEVVAISSDGDGVEVITGDGAIRARLLVNCAGLQSDRVAAMAGVDPPVRIVPFRGSYFALTAEAAALVRALIYPVPDPRYPFLGVHFTRRVDDTVEVGPNAVVALGREHYPGAGPSWRDVWDTVTFPGFLRLAARNWRQGAAEVWRSASRSLYARSARVLVPEIEAAHLVPGGAGIRAQAVTRDGALVDDFALVATDDAVHVLNAPSPGATASLAIGDHIAGLVAERLG